MLFNHFKAVVIHFSYTNNPIIINDNTLIWSNFFLHFNTAYCYPLDELPTFEWVDLYALKIVYPDGNIDFAYLKRYNPIPIGPNERAQDVDPCIFRGLLEQEKTVHVTLAGCPFTKNFQVIDIVHSQVNQLSSLCFTKESL